MTDTQKKGGKDTGKVTLKATCVCVTLLRFILPACMNQGLTQYIHTQSAEFYTFWVVCE